MSKEKKEPQIGGGPAAPAEELPIPTEPASAAVATTPVQAERRPALEVAGEPSVTTAQARAAAAKNTTPPVAEAAPLRLVIPVKYGVKNIKRIGTIRYSTLRPADYWAERGYGWYVGL